MMSRRPPGWRSYERTHSSVALPPRKSTDRPPPSPTLTSHAMDTRAKHSTRPPAHRCRMRISSTLRNCTTCGAAGSFGIVSRTAQSQDPLYGNSIQLDRDQLRDARLFHRHAVQPVGNLHGMEGVCDEG